MQRKSFVGNSEFNITTRSGGEKRRQSDATEKQTEKKPLKRNTQETLVNDAQHCPAKQKKKTKTQAAILREWRTNKRNAEQKREKIKIKQKTQLSVAAVIRR